MHSLSTLPRSASPLKLERTGVTSQSPHSAPDNPSEFWRSQSLFRDSIVAKVREEGYGHLVEKLAACQTEKMYVTCLGCSDSRVVFNHCDKKFCPLCTPRLAHKRRDSLEPWVRTVAQPKHVVLTMRNAAAITKRYVRSGQAAVSKLRRSKLAREWRGGLVSTEVTNEGRGWHLHYHLLVDCRWIDSSELAQKWAALIGQDFAIVKVKDARDRRYLQEVSKYAVKGSDMAGWSGAEMVAFIHAFAGVRTFHPFGSCFKLRAEVANWKAETASHRSRQCECGCRVFRIQDHVGTATEHAARKRPVRSMVVHR